jgi:hypothetical protein
LRTLFELPSRGGLDRFLPDFRTRSHKIIDLIKKVRRGILGFLREKRVLSFVVPSRLFFD